MEEIRGCRYVQRISINIVRFPSSLPHPPPAKADQRPPVSTADSTDISSTSRKDYIAYSPTWTIGLVAISCNNWSTYFDLSGYSSILEICKWNLSNVELFFLKQNEQHTLVNDSLQKRKKKKASIVRIAWNKREVEFFFAGRDINSREEDSRSERARPFENVVRSPLSTSLTSYTRWRPSHGRCFPWRDTLRDAFYLAYAWHASTITFHKISTETGRYFIPFSKSATFFFLSILSVRARTVGSFIHGEWDFLHRPLLDSYLHSVYIIGIVSVLLLLTLSRFPFVPRYWGRIEEEEDKGEEVVSHRERWLISGKFLAAFFPLLTFREKGNRGIGESSRSILANYLEDRTSDSTCEKGWMFLRILRKFFNRRD